MQACPIITFIVGFFFFPVWWGACCMLCNPYFGGVGRALNIASTVLGVLWGIWIPALIIGVTVQVAIDNIMWSGGGAGGGLGTYYSSYYSLFGTYYYLPYSF
jgi:hypothetical protein